MANTLHNPTRFDFRSDLERRESFAEGHSFTALAGFDSVKCCIRRVLKCVLARACVAVIAVLDAADKTNDYSIGRVGMVSMVGICWCGCWWCKCWCRRVVVRAYCGTAWGDFVTYDALTHI